MLVPRRLRARPVLLVLTAALGAACGDSGSPPPDDAGGAGGGGGADLDAAGGGGAGGSTDGGVVPRDGTGVPDARADDAVGPVDARGSDVTRPDGNGGADGGAPPDGASSRDANGQDGTSRDGAVGQDSGSRPDGGTLVDGGLNGDGGPPGWTLVWSDEFNAASGTGVDTTKWNLVNKGDGFGNSELEFYTNRTENAYHDGNGFLVIKAIKESYMGHDYTSARLESSGKFERMYGRFEARMQLPRGQGIWPAFWMLGNDIGTVSWPACGEIDIMENIGKEPSIVHGSLHGPGYSGGNPLGQSYTLPNGGKFADAFHVFAVEWELNVVRFYVDDTLYGTKTPADTPAGAHWAYDHPFYLLLNVAVGGTWPGSPDSTTVFPQTMTVDYVRVYTR